MRWTMTIFGVLSIVASIAAVAAIRSDIQLIVVIVLFGFGLVLLGLGSVLDHLVQLTAGQRADREMRRADEAYAPRR